MSQNNKNALYDKYASIIYGIAYNRLKDKLMAEKLTSSIFAALFNLSIKPDAAFSTIIAVVKSCTNIFLKRHGEYYPLTEQITMLKISDATLMAHIYVGENTLTDLAQLLSATEEDLRTRCIELCRSLRVSKIA